MLTASATRTTCGARSARSLAPRRHPRHCRMARTAAQQKRADAKEEEAALTSERKASTTADTSGSGSSSTSKALVLAAVLVAGSTGYWALSRAGWGMQDLEALIAGSGPAGPLVFVGAYVAATVLLFPASILTLGAGYLFGPLQGTALVSLASTLGACAAFLAGRYLARPWAESQLGRLPRFAAIDEAVARQGARIVLLLRLSPLFPFNLLNYALGLTRIDFLPYAAASWAGMLPGTFTYVYLGSVGKAAVDAAGEAGQGGDGAAGAARVALYVLGAAATLAVTKFVADAAGKALDESSGEGGAGDGSSKGGP